ncbi:anchored repeat-type ABC transporter permease subunit [Corynebacterium uterequi]|uniref:Anchored repeat-type ABC transporter, permease subunit n=1 Tax=Corynebacterium uterequi TaxID=1072256 RepID=A0A0G3HJE3_9CORY|nr:anchored repeat-type ABC transporter permease subunit [Corynebacterium uterequi]AKK12073.1 anchored repeat-type ABC transporter, permease subunit [Corynebacterium uterequi]
MLTFTQFLADLTNPALEFLPRALAAALISAVVCAVVGAHVVLRSLAFIGDAVAHAVFPGIAIAFVLQGSVLLGGAIAGAAVALIIAVTSQRRRVKEDTIIGIVFAGAFALGMVIISRAAGYSASLTSFLFGSLTGVSRLDVITSAVVGAIVIGAVLLCHRQLVAVALDRETARAMNLRVLLLDIVLYFAVTAAVVISVRTVGNILVLALLVTPAASARLLTDRLGVMMWLSAAFGAAGCILGMYLSWAANLPSGATIVLTLTGLFAAAWVLAPKHGLLGRLRRPAAVGA